MTVLNISMNYQSFEIYILHSISISRQRVLNYLLINGLMAPILASKEPSSDHMA